MIVLVTNPVWQTYIFTAVLLLTLILSIRKRQDQDFFPISASQELKGLAILTVIFAHVAYALVSDSAFLHPLSTMAGVGVNLFLLLSGYGLIISSLKKPATIWQFYKYRLSKLYIPFWICLAAFFLLDFFWLGRSYGASYTLQSFLGFFNHADLYVDVNSPFWYFTWIVMYYLLFPWLLIKKAPWLSAILIYLLTLSFVKLEPHFVEQVMHLYKIHIIAFPLGMLLGWLVNFKAASFFNQKFLPASNIKKNILRFVASILLIIAVLFLAQHSGVGERPLIEEIISIITCLVLIALFLIKRIEIKTLYWLGFFSYEIYMFHWPLMYRYDFLFKFFPAWLAMALYLVVFVAFAWLMRLIIQKTSLFFAKKA